LNGEKDPLTVIFYQYSQARAIISAYKEAQKNKPKRQSSEKQLAA